MIEKGISLKDYNTFGIDSFAKELISIRKTDDIKRFIENNKPYDFILGGGSNVLLTKDNYNTVLLNEIKGIEIINESNDFVEIRIGSGEIWDDLVAWAVDNNFGGIENLSLIPGTVGASPIQNIGAYGVDVKDVLTKVEVIDLSSSKIVFFNNQECKFGYRESIFKNIYKGKFFITAVYLKLSKTHKLSLSYGNIKDILKANGIDKPTIKDVRDAVISIRESKLPDPKILGNSGSFFKNPFVSKTKLAIIQKDWPEIKYYPVDDEKVKIPAAWLLDKAGWKGKTIGNVGCHKNQPLVVVNYGNATGKEVFDFAQNVIKDIKAKFEISLTPEVNIL